MKPYYEHAGITIYHGDCREVLPNLGRFDITVTDPPYGIGIAANPVRQKHVKRDWDNAPPADDVFGFLRFISKYQVFWGGNYFDLPPAQCFLVWDKVQPENFSLAMCEQAWTNFGKPAKMFRRHVVSFDKQHPTQKPIELMKWCIATAPEECRSVLDPFAGSGTTLEAAKALGLTAVGIEIEERYCEIAAERLSQEVLGLTGPRTDEWMAQFGAQDLLKEEAMEAGDR